VGQQEGDTRSNVRVYWLTAGAIGLLTAIVAIIVALIAANSGTDDLPPGPVQTATTAAASSVEITSPHPGQHVPNCIAVELARDIPDDKALWVFMQPHRTKAEDANPEYYLAQPAKPGQNHRWTTPRMRLYAEDTVGEFNLYAIVVDKVWGDYLGAIDNYPNVWASALPPGPRAYVTVVRDAEPGGPSCG
jgi:hypothetical protein